MHQVSQKNENKWYIQGTHHGDTVRYDVTTLERSPCDGLCEGGGRLVEGPGCLDVSSGSGQPASLLLLHGAHVSLLSAG